MIRTMSIAYSDEDPGNEGWYYTIEGDSGPLEGTTYVELRDECLELGFGPDYVYVGRRTLVDHFSRVYDTINKDFDTGNVRMFQSWSRKIARRAAALVEYFERKRK